MPRNTSEVLNLGDPLGGDSLPHGKRLLRKTKVRRKPADQAALSADQGDPVHAAHITPSSIKPQEIKNYYNDTLAVRIREARLDLGLRQADLAKLMRVKQVTISQWETGKPPALVNRIRLAEVLRLDWRQLMPEADFKPPDAGESAAVRRLFVNIPQLVPSAQEALDLLVQQILEKRRS